MNPNLNVIWLNTVSNLKFLIKNDWFVQIIKEDFDDHIDIIVYDVVTNIIWNEIWKDVRRCNTF